MANSEVVNVSELQWMKCELLDHKKQQEQNVRSNTVMLRSDGALCQNFYDHLKPYVKLHSHKHGEVGSAEREKHFSF